MRHAPRTLTSTAARAALASLASLAAYAALACSGARADERGPVAGGNPEHGPALMQRYGCSSCHVVAGLRGAVGTAGPPLTGFAERMYIGGSTPNEPESLVRWIRDPQSVQPNTAMPDLGVTEADARHLAAYLYTLR